MPALAFGVLVALGGCVASDAPRVALPAPVVIPPQATPTALTADADAALKAAELSVIDARVRRALWTAAVEELDKARAAAKKFDSDNTLVHAKEVVTLCALAIQQTSAPPVKW